MHSIALFNYELLKTLVPNEECFPSSFVQDEGACMVAGVSGAPPVLVDHDVQVDQLILGPTIRNHG